VAGLQKYTEWLSRGRRTERVAYVLKKSFLPTPIPGAEWRHDTTFNAAEAILAHPDLKDAFSAAIKDGVAVVTRREGSHDAL
jgi:hypothetical protein